MIAAEMPNDPPPPLEYETPEPEMEADVHLYGAFGCAFTFVVVVVAFFATIIVSIPSGFAPPSALLGILGLALVAVVGVPAMIHVRKRRGFIAGTLIGVGLTALMGGICFLSKK